MKRCQQKNPEASTVLKSWLCYSLKKKKKKTSKGLRPCSVALRTVYLSSDEKYLICLTSGSKLQHGKHLTGQGSLRNKHILNTHCFVFFFLFIFYKYIIWLSQAAKCLYYFFFIKMKRSHPFTSHWGNYQNPVGLKTSEASGLKWSHHDICWWPSHTHALPAVLLFILHEKQTKYPPHWIFNTICLSGH